MKKHILHIGIADFAEPTLLLIGDAFSFCWLSDRIASRETVDFAEMKNLVEQAGINLCLIPSQEKSCLCRHGNNNYDWLISLEDSEKFVEQLRSLARSNVPCHAYLDPALNADEMQIIASFDEYNPIEIFPSVS